MDGYKVQVRVQGIYCTKYGAVLSIELSCSMFNNRCIQTDTGKQMEEEEEEENFLMCWFCWMER